MYDEIIRRLASASSSDFGKSFVLDGKSQLIDPGCFSMIANKTSTKKVGFIDGGSAEIIGSSSFSLGMVRVSCVIYQDSAKKSTKAVDFFCFSEASANSKGVFYKNSFINLPRQIQIPELEIDPADPTLSTKAGIAEIGINAGLVRRLAELSYANHIASGENPDVIVLDGSLKTTTHDEEKSLMALSKVCDEKSIVLIALSKTNRIFTDTGKPIGIALMNFSRNGSWIYNVEPGKFLARLHKKSAHVFYVESNSKDINEIASILEMHSNDPVFLGYPYGLVEADRHARISNSEKDSIRTVILNSSRAKGLDAAVSSVNAHSILDRINY